MHRAELTVADHIGKNAFRSSLTTSLTNVVLLITGVFMTPFIMTGLGDEQNGYWVIIKMIIGYYGFVDFGISSAVARFVAVEIGKEDLSRAKTIVETGLTFILLLDGVLVVLVGVGSAVAGIWFPVHNGMSIGQLVLLVGVSMVLSLPGRVFMGVLRGHIRDDLVALGTVIVTLLRTAFIFVFLTLNFGLFTLTAITGGGLIVLSGLFYAIARRIMPELKQLRLGLDFGILRDLVEFGFSLTLAGMGDIVRWSAAPVIAALVCGSVFVTHLNIAFSLSQYGLICVSGFFSAFMPVFGQLSGTGDPRRLKRVFYKILAVTVSVAGLVFGGILFFW